MMIVHVDPHDWQDRQQLCLARSNKRLPIEVTMKNYGKRTLRAMQEDLSLCRFSTSTGARYQISRLLFKTYRLAHIRVTEHDTRVYVSVAQTNTSPAWKRAKKSLLLALEVMFPGAQHREDVVYETTFYLSFLRPTRFSPADTSRALATVMHEALFKDKAYKARYDAMLRTFFLDVGDQRSVCQST